MQKLQTKTIKYGITVLVAANEIESTITFALITLQLFGQFLQVREINLHFNKAPYLQYIFCIYLLLKNFKYILPYYISALVKSVVQ